MRTLLYLSGGRVDDSITRIPAQILELALEVRAALSPRRHLQTRQQAQSLQTGKEYENEELRFRRVSRLACGLMCFVSFS